MSIRQLERLTEVIEIHYEDETGALCRRRFKLVEHSRRELDEFIRLQLESGRRCEEEAKLLAPLATVEQAGEMTRAAFGVPAKAAAEIVVYCLKYPEDGKPAPDADWVANNLTLGRMKQIITAQEELDGIDASLRKNVDLIQAMALQERMNQDERARTFQAATKSLSPSPKPKGKAKR